MNRDVIKKYKDVFDWWVETDGIVWYKEQDSGAEWIPDDNPGWTGKNYVYVQDDEYAEFRKALADGKPVYVNFGGTIHRVIRPTFVNPASDYSLTKPRWRAVINKTYWYLTSELDTSKDYDRRWQADDDRYSLGNYFKTEAEAAKAAVKIKQTFKEIRNEQRMYK